MLITPETHKPETKDWYGFYQFWQEVNKNQNDISVNENMIKKKGE